MSTPASTQSKLHLKIIIASMRPGRVGLPIGEWFYSVATQSPLFETEILDLAKINLPMMDEPNHPRLQQYTKQHTKQWSAKISNGDAFVFVIPEYNFSLPASLKNAMDYLQVEWQYKPVAMVNYGYISTGTRSAEMVKQVATALSMIPLYDAVNVPLMQVLDEQGQFHANERLENNAQEVLQKLAIYARHCQGLRQEMLAFSNAK